jgi:hypothetical protein
MVYLTPKPKAAKVKVSEKVIHPKSRKAAQMVKNAHRKDKVDRYGINLNAPTLSCCIFCNARKRLNTKFYEYV